MGLWGGRVSFSGLAGGLGEGGGKGGLGGRWSRVVSGSRGVG